MRNEIKTIRKWFFIWDFEKEEAWLNEMAQNGWVLVKVGFCSFHFMACDCGEYIIRLEMHSDDQDYINLIRETGVEYIGRVVQWIYLRRRAEFGPFDIFSDLDSKIAHLKRMSASLSLIGLANIFMGVSQSIARGGMGWLNLLVATVLTYGLGRIHGKKESLEKERLLHE